MANHAAAPPHGAVTYVSTTAGCVTGWNWRKSSYVECRRMAERELEPLNDSCPMCDEPVVPGGDISPTSLFTAEGPQRVHRSCMLREVLGGIGHLIAHDYWCTERHDPDANLTYRQSALLVDAFVAVVGVEPLIDPREFARAAKVLDSLPDALRTERARRNLRQADAAAEAAIDQQTWSRYERGANLPRSRETLWRMIVWLNGGKATDGS
jgi:hypothetical protein